MIIKGFTRVNEHGDPELLENTELTELTNGKIKGGKIYRRDALVQYNSNDAGGGIKSLHDVEDEDGNNYLLAVQGTALKKSANGTGSWSNVKTGLTGVKARVASYYGKHYVTNNNDAVFYTDLTNVHDLEVEELDATQITTSIGSPGSLDYGGVYKWAFVFFTAEGAISSIFTPMTVSNDYVDDGILWGDFNVTFSNIPNPSDARVISKRIYRTKNGGSIFYLVDSIETDVSEYTDVAADTSLITADILVKGLVPDKAKFVEIHRDRLFFANLTKTSGGVETPAYFEKFAVDSVVNVSTITRPNGTGLGDGTYRWKYTFEDADGNESRLIDGYLENTITFNADNGTNYEASVKLKGFPNKIKSKTKWLVLYRTTYNDNSTYYYVTKYLLDDALSTTDVVDSVRDSGLGDAYPHSDLGETTQTNKDEVIWSEIGSPSLVKSINSLRVFAGNGGDITGIIDNFDGLLVFKENLIAKIFTEGSPFNWQVLRISENIGCDEPDSVAAIDRVVYFMHNRKVYRYGQSVEDISLEFQTTLQSVDTVHDAAFSTKYNWYILLVTISSTRYILVRDEDAKSWYKFNVNDGQFTPEAVVTRQYEDSGEFTFAHNNMGYLNSFDDSTESDQYSSSYIVVPVTIATKTFYLSDPIAKIRAREILANYDKKAKNDVVIKAEDTFNLVSRTFTHNTNSGNVFVRKATDSLTGTLKESTTVKFTISGGGINSFNSLKFKYKALRRGRG